MRIVRDFERLPEAARGASLAIGNFDGVHPGHLAVLQAMLDAPEAMPKAVLTFAPHPKRFFRPGAPAEALEPFQLRARRFAALGVEWLFCQRFDAGLAAQEAEAYVGDFLIGRLGVKRLITGEDFAFGRGRGGNAGLLARMAAEAGVAYRAVPPVEGEDGIHASSRIRALLAAGEPGLAARLLGREYEMSGRVTHGDARGREMGRPTLNLRPGPGLIVPKYGVYAVRFAFGEARLGAPEDGWRDGVANLGIRPTFGGEEPRLEIHAFDRPGEPLGERYGERIRVRLVRFLRAERRFESAEALVAQIGLDVEAAKTVLSAAR